jgi:hypothetical protein
MLKGARAGARHGDECSRPVGVSQLRKDDLWLPFDHEEDLDAVILTAKRQSVRFAEMPFDDAKVGQRAPDPAVAVSGLRERAAGI